MFSANWLMISKVIAASLLKEVDYPTASDFFLKFNYENTLYTHGYAKVNTTNVAVYYNNYKHEMGNAYPINITETGEYQVYADIGDESYLTNIVDVKSFDESNLFNQYAQLIPSTPISQSQAGTSVALSENYYIVGEIGYGFESGGTTYRPGGARIYDHNFNEITLLSSFENIYSNFGRSVAISDKYAFVSDSTARKVYEYENFGSTWNLLSTKLGNYFGYGDSIAFNGEFLFIAETGYTGGGRVLVYTWNPVTNSHSKYIVALYPETETTEFGRYINVHENLLIIGTISQSVYVYRFNTSTRFWVRESIITSPLPNISFGGDYNVAIHGERVAIGAYRYDHSVLIPDSGIVYIYKYSPSTTDKWVLETSLEPPNPTTNSYYAGTLSMNDKMIIVGARELNQGSEIGAGGVYIYKLIGSEWVYYKFILPSYDYIRNYMNFGSYIATKDNYTIIGARGLTLNGTIVTAGSSYVFANAPPNQLSYKVSNNLPIMLLQNTTNPLNESSLRLDSNTWNIGNTSQVFINKGGDYKSFTVDYDNNVAHFGNTTIDTSDKMVVRFVNKNASDLIKVASLVTKDANIIDPIYSSVAISKNYAVFGKGQFGTYESGHWPVGYVVKRTGNTFNFLQHLTISQSPIKNVFGRPINITDDYIVASGYETSDNDATKTYAIIIYERNGDIWEYKDKKKSATTGETGYGFSTRIYGRYIVVGEPEAADDGISGTGQIHIYYRNDSGVWTLTQTIRQQSVTSQKNFGSSVGIYEDTIVSAGYIYDQYNYLSDIYIEIYKKDPYSSTWLHADTVSIPVIIDGNVAFNVISIYKNYLTIGCNYVYIFKKGDNEEKWYFNDRIPLSSDFTTHRNIATDIYENYIAAGVIYRNGSKGAVHIINKNGNTWSNVAVITNDSINGKQLGYDVKIYENNVITTIPVDDDVEGSYGMGYIYNQNFLSATEHDGYNKIKTLASSNQDDNKYNTLKFGSNTWNTNGASDLFISEPGEYTHLSKLNSNESYLSTITVDKVITGYVNNTFTTSTLIQKINYTEPADSAFGSSVDIDGEYAIIGGPVIFKNNNNQWIFDYNLRSSDAQSADGFGFSVSISGDYAVVGAPYKTYNVYSDHGAVYTFKRNSITNQWSQISKILPNVNQSGVFFGYSVSIDGEYLVVGAKQENTGGTSAGAAYIYKRNASDVWELQNKVLGSSQAGALLGISVSIKGEYIVIGAGYENVSADGVTNQTAGAAYIYSRNGNLVKRIYGSDIKAGAQFGFSVDISETHVAVGAPVFFSSAANEVGKVYIFEINGTECTEQVGLVTGNEDWNQFGYSVSIDGNYLLVGERLRDYNTISNVGAAHLYRLNEGIWELIPGTIRPIQKKSSQWFGHAVKIHNDKIIICSYNATTENIFNAYSSYLGDGLYYDNINTLRMISIEPDFFIRWYSSNKLIGSENNKREIQLENSGSYRFIADSSNTFIMSNEITINDDLLPVYQYPPMSGTRTVGTVTEAPGFRSDITVSDNNYGNGVYKIDSSVSTVSGNGPYNLLDLDYSSVYLTDFSNTCKITIILPESVVIQKYHLVGYDNSNQSPKSWRLEAYNTNTTSWVVVDTRTNFPINRFSLGFTVTNPIASTEYSLVVTENCGATQNVSIDYLGLFGDIPFDITFDDNWVQEKGVENVTIGSGYVLPGYTSIHPVIVTGAEDFNSSVAGTYKVIYTYIDINGLTRRMVRTFVVE